MLNYEYYYGKYVYSTVEKVYAAQKYDEETGLWLIMFDEESEALAYLRCL